MNWMYSADSLSHSVYARFGFADDAPSAGTAGCGWARVFAASYSADPGAALAAIVTPGLPPWHVAHPSTTVPDGCIEASSVFQWHVTHPAGAARASSGVAPPAPSLLRCWPRCAEV